jgi:hypothetical protein
MQLIIVLTSMSLKILQSENRFVSLSKIVPGVNRATTKNIWHQTRKSYWRFYRTVVAADDHCYIAMIIGCYNSAIESPIESRNFGSF